eukprot:TRINITY_DN284_c0_g1_i2.p1 TRINITY_DN284_c0_g1~~TRINITY_DN284_c0_g1_i2.p1  ORF type:complete len:136 (+),score=34.77 TRINITY_DN284_c0_g1_i2:204-611(+)
MATLQRTRSTVPCATHVYESAVIQASVDTVWSSIRSMDFGYNDLIAGAELKSGNCPNEVGSVHELMYKDGTSWTVQLLELSDFRRTLVLDLLERTDGVSVSSCMHQISLKRITQDDTTLAAVSYTHLTLPTKRIV